MVPVALRSIPWRLPPRSAARSVPVTNRSPLAEIVRTAPSPLVVTSPEMTADPGALTSAPSAAAPTAVASAGACGPAGAGAAGGALGPRGRGCRRGIEREAPRREHMDGAARLSLPAGRRRGPARDVQLR